MQRAWQECILEIFTSFTVFHEVWKPPLRTNPLLQAHVTHTVIPISSPHPLSDLNLHFSGGQKGIHTTTKRKTCTTESLCETIRQRGAIAQYILEKRGFRIYTLWKPPAAVCRNQLFCVSVPIPAGFTDPDHCLYELKLLQLTVNWSSRPEILKLQHTYS